LEKDASDLRKMMQTLAAWWLTPVIQVTSEQRLGQLQFPEEPGKKS
jgi:hypothetical protein